MNNLIEEVVLVKGKGQAENDKGVFLRVWQDENQGNSCLVCMNDINDTRLGQSERKRHIKCIEQGKPGYVIQITEGEQVADGNWKIKAYQESILKIYGFHTNDNGDIYAEVNFDEPIIPEFIGQEIDIKGIINAAKRNKVASELLSKAMDKFNWQPTQLCEQQNLISLVSADGKQFASINISEGEWIRV